MISEIELAYRHKGAGKVIGITGSNGKSTTTAMTYHICRHGGLDCALVGNIGISFAPPGGGRSQELVCGGDQQLSAG